MSKKGLSGGSKELRPIGAVCLKLPAWQAGWLTVSVPPTQYPAVQHGEASYAELLACMCASVHELAPRKLEGAPLLPYLLVAAEAQQTSGSTPQHPPFNATGTETLHVTKPGIRQVCSAET
jgi:hypothetical protein